MNTVTRTRSRARKVLVLSSLLLLPVVALAGIVYGPELVRLVQLGQQIEQEAQDDARVAGAWPRTSDACIGCHGVEGNARTQTYPSLAGQPEAYLKQQLTAFASGERSDPTMTPLALSMSAPELDGLAAYFSKMQPQPNTRFHADAARVARGEALAKANNCAACHGAQLEGKGGYPRLAGQGHDYLRDQLTRFKNGTRYDATGAMPAIAGALSPQDIDDLSQFIASR